VIISGLADLGTEVARYLRSLDIPVVVAEAEGDDRAEVPDLPLVRGPAESALEQANVTLALSVMALTSDEVANLERALVARAMNRDCTLVIRVQDAHFSENVSRLVPRAYAMSVHGLAAEAFATAAFGESILGLARIDGQTALVTEYLVERGDSLDDLLLAEILYGYGVVPLLHETGGVADFLPGDEKRLRAGDRLVVLATIDGLQRVEQRLPRPAQWRLRLECALTKEAAFEGALSIARSTRCGLEAAQVAMASLPCLLECVLYKQQAQRLVRKLARTQVHARIEPMTPTSSPGDTTAERFGTFA
jgi:Trk K+ transport system NAD-binding subunit